jgi:uncharacterized protein YggE
MKKKFMLFAVIAAILLVSVLLVGCQASGSTTFTANTNQQTGISVSGQGIVYVTPDIVNLQLGIQAQAATVADAQSQAATAMNNVLAALAANGVAKADIQTQNYSIQQTTRYDNVKQQEISTGYQVINYVNVKVRDVTKAGVILDAVTAAGGDLTRVNSVQFSLNDPTSANNQARDQAMADAKATAAQLASDAGVKLGNPISISESEVSPISKMYASDMAVPSASGSTTISSGELEITVSVQVTYAIQ